MHNVSPFADLLTLQNEMREGFVPPAVVENSRDAEIAELNQRLAEKDARIEALSGALDDAISLLDRAVMEETPDDYGDTYKAVSDVLAGKALAPKNPA